MHKDGKESVCNMYRDDTTTTSGAAGYTFPPSLNDPRGLSEEDRLDHRLHWLHAVFTRGGAGISVDSECLNPKQRKNRTGPQKSSMVPRSPRKYSTQQPQQDAEQEWHGFIAWSNEKHNKCNWRQLNVSRNKFGGDNCIDREGMTLQRSQ